MPTYKNQITKLHPNNSHQGRYDFKTLCECCPELKPFILPNPQGDHTIDFSNPQAVLYLNKALLLHTYNIKNWQIPTGYLCPPIPGRADYIHHLADLLNSDKSTAKTKTVRVLDIGTGANCIYPIIGSQSLGWNFVASECDPIALNAAQTIVHANPCLQKHITLVVQKEKQMIFKGVLTGKFDLTMCNPPFYTSQEEALAANRSKLKGLNKNKKTEISNVQNFGGQPSELWCTGGELSFIKRMAKESVAYADQVGWFTSLVSKSEHLREIKKRLSRLNAKKVKVIEMGQGQKISRFIAWHF